MKLLIGTVVLAIAASQPAAANAAETPDQLISAMRKVGTAWQRIADNKEVFITRCEHGGFAAFRFKGGSSATYDVIKTNSLMNPYQGIVHLTAIFQENTSSYDRSCSPSIEEAKSKDVWWGLSDLVNWTVLYKFDGSDLVVDNINQTFVNNGGYALRTMSAEGSNPDWFTILRFSPERPQVSSHSVRPSHSRHRR